MAETIAMMRAVVLRATGGPEMLVPDEVPVPTLGPGQVLVRTEAIGVSSGETRLRAGMYPLPVPPPVVLGAEAAGVVERLGDGVDPALKGARLVFVTGGVGSYAEFVAVDVAKATRIPDGLSSADAVAAGAPGAVAIALLHTAGLGGGETVLVEGGSGKVGGYLVRHAHELGAGRVVATAGTEVGRDRARELGADVVLDHTDPQWTDELRDIDVVFEAIGGDVAGRVLAALTPGTGRTLLYGTLSGRPAELDMATVASRGLRVVGCGGPVWFRDVLGVYSPEFLALAARGGSYLQPIDVVLPLAEAAEAHRRIESGTTNGRILLTP
jgi:NADPH2:quinone reductase